MESTKFHELCSAYGQAQDKFDDYKTDCHLIAVEVVKELKAYYQVPESQFSLYRINQQDEFKLVQPELIHAIDLKSDHNWHFGIGLTVCKAAETLPEELILIQIIYRKNTEGKYFIKYAIDKKEFEIIKGNSDSFIPFFNFLFDEIIESYQEHLQQFIGDKTERKLGYRQ